MKHDRYTPLSALGFLLVSFLVVGADARPVSLLSYQQLLDKSDLVVIATPTSRTTNTKEQFPLPGVSMNNNGNITAVTCFGAETTFAISATLKGHKGVRKLILHHCGLNRGPNQMNVNGPMLVSFDPADKRMSGSFLMFLVRESDGRYAPTGGQSDPGINAITKLQFTEPLLPRP